MSTPPSARLPGRWSHWAHGRKIEFTLTAVCQCSASLSLKGNASWPQRVGGHLRGARLLPKCQRLCLRGLCQHREACPHTLIHPQFCLPTTALSLIANLVEQVVCSSTSYHPLLTNPLEFHFWPLCTHGVCSLSPATLGQAGSREAAGLKPLT